MRLIDADKISWTDLADGRAPSPVLVTFADKVNKMPTIEPQRKSGKWEMVSQHENPPTYIYSCSECRHKSFGFYNYCPNCGADMREEGEAE